MPSFKTPIVPGCLILAGFLWLLFSGCGILKGNLDNADLKKFSANNQPYIDSISRTAARSFALGFADSAQLISRNLMTGLKGSMDTLDPDFKKIKRAIEELGQLSGAQLDSIGTKLESKLNGIKDNIKDEELKKYLVSIIEESTGTLKKSTKKLLSDMIQDALDSFDAQTAKEKIQVIINGALGDSTRKNAQLLVSEALQPTMDSLFHRIEKVVNKDLPFVQRKAKELLVALALLAAAIIGWVWYQRRRYAKLVALLTYQIDKIPSQTLYDELTKRIRNEAQRAELEPLLRDTLKEQGINA